MNLLWRLLEPFQAGLALKTICKKTMRKELHKMGYISSATRQKRLQCNVGTKLLRNSGKFSVTKAILPCVVMDAFMFGGWNYYIRWKFFQDDSVPSIGPRCKEVKTCSEQIWFFVHNFRNFCSHEFFSTKGSEKVQRGIGKPRESHVVEVYAFWNYAQNLTSAWPAPLHKCIKVGFMKWLIS